MDERDLRILPRAIAQGRQHGAAHLTDLASERHVPAGKLNQIAHPRFPLLDVFRGFSQLLRQAIDQLPLEKLLAMRRAPAAQPPQISRNACRSVTGRGMPGLVAKDGSGDFEGRGDGRMDRQDNIENTALKGCLRACGRPRGPRVGSPYERSMAVLVPQ
jgi:hypothetical protein